MERSKLAHIPWRNEIEAKLLDLIEGRCTREEVSNWAAPWITTGNVEVEDFVAWEMLKLLMAADLKTSPDSYLYQEDDFRGWLEELRAGSSAEGNR